MLNFYRPKGTFKIYCFGMQGREHLIETIRPMTIEECLDLLGKEKWMSISKNITVDEGNNDNLDVYFKSGSASANWYIGLKSTNQTHTISFNAAGIGTQFTEGTGYSEGTRQAWTTAAVSSKTITNSASPATFSMSGSATIYGAFLINNNTKGGTTGKMWACSDFSVARPVVNGDTLKVVYTIQGQDV